MPKRKREFEIPEAGSDDEDAGKSLRQRRVEHKLDQGYKLLNRAFRTAKGFERQKLGRRRKTACEKSDAKDVARIDTEIEAIKTLEFSSAARQYLHKSLLKFKAITESPDLPPIVSKPTPPIGDAAKANVIARLCNSNPVKEALPPILKDIQQALGLKISDDALKGKKRLRAKDFEKDDKNGKKTQTAKAAAGDDSDVAEEDVELRSRGGGVMQRRPHSDNEDDFMEDVDDDEKEHDPADDYDSADFMEFNGRIAASSDEEDESDSESDEAPKKTKTSRGKPLRKDVSASPEPDRSIKTNKSAFVPSLTMGGYWSGSESEPESDVDVAPRKNRRGQRARQQLAEKKFGQRAKHLQKEGAVSRLDRNAGWDPKKGATDRSGPRARGPQKFGKSAPRISSDRGEVKSAPPPKKHRDDSGPLHPSWEAAKKAKEAKATAPFQGKKITFD